MKDSRGGAHATRTEQEKQRKLAVIQREHRVLRLRLRFVVGVVLVLGLTAFFAKNVSAPAPSQNYVVAALAGHPFKLDVADTPESRNQGLSGRANLSDNEGMLFKLESPAIACFWMKDMRFNLDLLWFDSEKKLIYEQKNLSPDSYPKQFCPLTPASYIVEIKPGVVQLKVGDPLVLQKQ